MGSRSPDSACAPARPQLPAPTADPDPGQAGQFYLSIRPDLVRDVRRTIRQELRSGRRPPRKRKRGGRKGRRVYWGREQLRRLRQSVGDQVCHSSVSALVATWHDAAVLSSAQIQVACASHQRGRLLFSLRAWRRWAPIVQCTAAYRCNMVRSDGVVKPAFQSWRRSVVPSAPPQLYPDPHARPFVCAPVERLRIEVLVDVVLALPVSQLLRHVKLWWQQCSEYLSARLSLIQAFSERRQYVRNLCALRGWLVFSRRRVKGYRIASEFFLRCAWVRWCSAYWEGSACSDSALGESCLELLECDPRVLDRHMEYQQLQKFQQGVRSRTGINACVVCPLPGSKKCSQCKSVWYCSRSCQSAHWSEHKGSGCFKLDTHIVGLLDECSSTDLQYLCTAVKINDDYCEDY